MELGRYTMMKHPRDEWNPSNPRRMRQLIKTSFTWKKNGLNNLKYGILARNESILFTWLLVDLFPPSLNFTLSESELLEESVKRKRIRRVMNKGRKWRKNPT